VSGRSGSLTPETSRDNLVGAVLIAAAVLLGVLLLAKGYDEEGGIVAASAPEESTTTTVAPPPTTAPIARPAAEVPVFVANGAGVTGAAGTLRDQLQADGYTQVEVGDAEQVTATVVYYAEGGQAEAEALSTAIGTDPAAVRALPADPPADPQGALVLVVIGPDTASSG
jgi:hypothetical protein